MAFELDGRHAWVFHRGSRVWRAGSFDASFAVAEKRPIAEHTVARLCLTTGRIVRQFGANEHYMPHGLTLAPNGDVWVTDVGAHVVIRYDAGGRRLATFGGKNTLETLEKNDEPPAPTRRARGDFSVGADPSGFCMPTDVAVAQDGTFWVSDGYCNDRVARFDADGAFADEWGPRGTEMANGVSGFDVPHSIALDFRRARLLVADRERARVTEHALDGTPLAAHDFGEHGYVYHVATLAAEDDGMSGFYALTWTRGDGKFEKNAGASRNATAPSVSSARLLAVWDDGGVGLKSTRLARWDLPFASVPHAIDVVGGGVGGTRAWGRGVSLFVTETGERERGDASLHRVWLGERFDARSDVVVPARGWTHDDSRDVEAVDASTANDGAATTTASNADPNLRVFPAETEKNFGRAERVGADADRAAALRANDEDYEDAFDAEASVRVAAPQHGGGFGGFRPGGAVNARDRREPNLRLKESRASRLYALWGAGTLFAAALAFATCPRRGKAGWGRALEGRRDSRAREEPRRAGLEMT